MDRQAATRAPNDMGARLPPVIKDKLLLPGGWIDKPGVQVFNLYKAPKITLGDKSKAKFWVDHLRRIYPTGARHIGAWLAYCLQNPDKKINHALVLGGNVGIGKDTILAPVRWALGTWNCATPLHCLTHSTSLRAVCSCA
jgi:hypothetical protein